MVFLPMWQKICDWQFEPRTADLTTVGIPNSLCNERVSTVDEVGLIENNSLQIASLTGVAPYRGFWKLATPANLRTDESYSAFSLTRSLSKVRSFHSFSTCTNQIDVIRA
jgi:hypothetical protein